VPVLEARSLATVLVLAGHALTILMVVVLHISNVLLGLRHSPKASRLLASRSHALALVLVGRAMTTRTVNVPRTNSALLVLLQSTKT
jgi:hypothetical protein